MSQNHFRFLLALGCLASALVSQPAQGQAFEFANYQVVSSNRVGRTDFEYVLRVNLTNKVATAQGVKAQVFSWTGETTIVDGSASFGDLALGAGAVSLDTFTIRQNRLVPFNPADLQWFVSVQSMALSVTVDSPGSGLLTNGTAVRISGSVGAAVDGVRVGGVLAALSGTNFSASVALEEGRNTISVLATNQYGGAALANVVVNRDTTAPILSIDAPASGSVLAARQVTVTGQINDIVPGTVNPEQATVMVNGLPATILNRSYAIADVLLTPGKNFITAVGRDRAGNESQRQIEVTFQDPASQKRLVPLAGSGQTGMIGTVLPNPFVVELVDGNGVVQTNQSVTFQVTRNDGLLSVPPDSGRTMTLLTDDKGQAAVLFQVGTRSGLGYNEVSISSPGVAAPVIISASATGAPPANVVALIPETQVGEVGKPLPAPWTVFVTDAGGNPVADATVAFAVSSGDGRIGGATMVNTNTDSDGRASVMLTLGPNEGVNNNVVIAGVPGVTNSAATFVASGYTSGQLQDTRVVGLVLDHANRPMSNVLCRIENSFLVTVTDAQGQFVISNAPVGFVRLNVDARNRGYAGEWHALQFDLVTVAGRANSIDRPIYMLPLDSVNSKMAGGDQDVTLQLDGIPGSSLTVYAHSMRDANNQPVTNRVMWTQVNVERIPMAPPLGSQFSLAWTVQPSGARFNPPARVCLPNSSSYPPGQALEMFGFDHDIGAFVSLGIGTVSQDGAQICSNPGFGITKSGWGGFVPPPPPPTCVGGCDDKNPCTTDQCVNGVCVHTPVANGARCDDGTGCSVKICQNGNCVTQTQQANGQACDDNDFCTENDKCQDGTCKGEKKKDEIVPPAIKFDVKLENDPAAVAVKAFLQKLGLTKKVEAKFSVGGVRKRICCSEKMMLVENKTIAVSGELEIEITEVQLFGPRLPLPAPFDTGIGLFFKAKIQGAVTAAPLTYDNCKDLWQGGGTGGVGVNADILLRIKVSEIVKITPLAVSTGFSATCTISGSDHVRAKCTGNFNGLVLKSEFEFFNKKITLLDYLLVQPSSVGPFENILTFLE